MPTSSQSYAPATSRSPSIINENIDREVFGDRRPLSERDLVVTPPLEFHGVPDSLKPVMLDLQRGAPWFPPDMRFGHDGSPFS